MRRKDESTCGLRGMAQEAYTWTGDSEVWLKRPIRGHRGLRAKECAYINDHATDGASEKDTHP
jgi:hypothetical protein